MAKVKFTPQKQSKRDYASMSNTDNSHIHKKSSSSFFSTTTSASSDSGGGKKRLPKSFLKNDDHNGNQNNYHSSNQTTTQFEDANGERDDGYPWFGCICGKFHESFWIQCETCNAWCNVAPHCVGFDEYSVENGGIKQWQCPNCTYGSSSNSVHEKSRSHEPCQQHNNNNNNNKPQELINKEDLEIEDNLRLRHPTYSEDLNSLNNSILCKPQHILTERSIAVCSNLITHYLLRESHNDKKYGYKSSTTSFDKDLWKYIWNCLRYEQKLCGWDKGWNSYDSSACCNGKNGRKMRKKDYIKRNEDHHHHVDACAGTHTVTTNFCYYYIPKKSPYSNGRLGIDYFTSKEGVLAHICQVIHEIDNNAFDCFGENVIVQFIRRLTYADKNGYTYDYVKTNIGDISSSMSLVMSSSNIHGAKGKRGVAYTISSNADANRSTAGTDVVASSGRTSGHSRKNHACAKDELIALNQELLDCISNVDMERYSELSCSDKITYEADKSTSDDGGDLNRGLAKGDFVCEDNTNQGSMNSGTSSSYNRIFLTNPHVEFQGNNNEVAVLSYVRHDIDRHYQEIKRKEVRIWSRMNYRWKNTFSFTHSI